MLAPNPGTKSNVRNVLTGEPATDEIDSLKVVCSHFTDIVKLRHVRPMFRQHTPAEWVDLNLPLTGHPSSLEPEIEPYNPRKQAPERHVV